MKLQRADTLLFIGDSITHANRRPEEVHDCYSLGSGFVNLIAGSLTADHPHLKLQFINSGDCGDTVHHLSARWEKDCLSAKPEFVSILIGINDANPALSPVQSLKEFRDTYRRLLQITLPASRLIVLEPFAVATPEVSKAQLKNLKERQPIVRELAEEAGALFVPLQGVFDLATSLAPPRHWARDGIHPSTAGHQLIARAWLKAVDA
jgi:acyl-CoA thioesterase-1